MIVLSRNRRETAFDNELAESLAARFQTDVLSVPFLYDLRSFGPTVERLQSSDDPALFLIPMPFRAAAGLLSKLLGRDVAAKVVDCRATSKLEDILDRCAGIIREAGPNEQRIERLDEPTVARWYPVLDTVACTGCLECVNFCLFGVYAIGRDDRPFVDQPDACRDGCPACSRICPGGAIMFPMHDDEAIAGCLDAESVRKGIRSSIAEAERRRFGGRQPDELDELVDEVDRFMF